MLYPNIEAERSRIGLTKTELAKKLGIDRKTLGKWMESGAIPASKLVEMAELFNVSTDYLLGRADYFIRRTS